ncbi:MAG: ATP-binding protein [Chloroflexota bacterium]
MTTQSQDILSQDDTSAQARMTQWMAQAPAVIAILQGPEHRFVLANEQYRELVGREVLGKTLLEALPEVAGQGFNELLDRVYETGEPFVDKETFARLDRGSGLEDIYFDFVYAPIRDACGRVEAVFVHAIDVTDKVQARKALELEVAERAQAQTLLSGERTILEAIARGEKLGDVLEELSHFIERQEPGALCSILLLDEGGRLRHGAGASLPDAYKRGIDGIAIGERVGSCGTAAHRGEIVVVQDIATDPLWDDYRGLALDHGLRACWSSPIRSAGGEVLGTFALYHREPHLPAAGERELVKVLTYLAGMAIERHQYTASRRKATRALRDVAEHLRLATQAAGMFSWDIDLATESLEWSPNAAEVLGAPLPKTLGEAFGMIHPEYQPGVAAVFSRAIESGGDFEVEYQLVGRSRHDELWVSTSGVVVDEGDGSPAHVVGTTRNISARKRDEAELQDALDRANAAVHARDEFLSIAAHELRTPVTVVKGVTQMLQRSMRRDRLDPERLREHLRTIDKTSNRLVMLIDDLLNVSRLQSGQMELHPEPLDLADVVRETAQRYETQLGRSHTLLVDVPDQPVILRADAARLEQILGNLLDNAVKYSPSGGAIELALCADDNGAIVAVTDHGIGLPEGTRESIFEPFGRAANAVEAGVPGMGLGLHVSRRVAQLHGGTLRAHSPGPNHGTTVTLRLPRP